MFAALPIEMGVAVYIVEHGEDVRQSQNHPKPIKSTPNLPEDTSKLQTNTKNHNFHASRSLSLRIMTQKLIKAGIDPEWPDLSIETIQN